MRIYNPLLNPEITQRFGENDNSFYEEQKLLGHPGTDMITHPNDVILSGTFGVCYKVYNKNNPDLSKYRAVCVLTQDDNGNPVEITYGHLSDIFVNEGDEVQIGTRLGIIGNTGDVYYKGQPVTEDQRKLGYGIHLHLQKRIVAKQQDAYLGNQYLETHDGLIYRDANKMCYIVPNYKNGYNGCIDIEPDLTVWAGYYKPVQETPQNQEAVKLELGLVERIVLAIYNWIKGRKTK